MDDLKIVFYIIVAIIWVIFNNYKKISAEAKKRDPSRPVEHIPEENWPKDPVPAPPVERKAVPPKVLRRKATPNPMPERRVPEPLRRTPLKKERVSSTYQSSLRTQVVREGGMVQPSKMVRFEDPVVEPEQVNPWTETIRNADFRSAIVLSEILKRPYN